MNRAQLSVAEAQNIHKAIVKYLASRPTRRRAPFTLRWLYRLHKEMFGDVWVWAGTRRQEDLNLGIPHQNIDTSLQQLLDDLAFWRDGTSMEVIERAAMLHYRAVHIHPFLNGNGRWSRLLANIYLKQMRHPVIVWPDTLIGEESVIRKDYIECIKAADRGDYRPLIAMHRKYSVGE